MKKPAAVTVRRSTPASAPMTPLAADDNPFDFEAEAVGVACTVIAATLEAVGAAEVS